MVVTTVSIRLALKRIAEICCGTAPKLIHVKALGDSAHRIFAVSIPWEYRAEVESYLADHLSISRSNSLLTFTAEQAAALVELALRADLRPLDRVTEGAGLVIDPPVSGE